MAMPYLNDPAVLKAWFERANIIQWKLYSGFQQALTSKHAIEVNNDEQLSQDDSWALLKQAIEQRGRPGTKFTILLSNGKRGTGNENQMQTFMVPIAESGSGGGIGSLYGGGGGFNIREEIEKERRLWDLERKLEDMEAANAPTGIMARIGERLIDDENFTVGVINMVQMMIAKFAGTPLQMPTGMEGLPGIQGSPNPDTETTQQAAMGLLQVAGKHFESQEQMFAFMAGVIEQLEENPELTKRQYLK